MMDLETLRAAWSADWQAIKAGRYVAPLPFKRKVVRLDRPNNVPPPNKATEEAAARKAGIIEAYQRGDKVAVICAEFDVCVSYIQKVVRAAGVQMRPRGRVRK